jgi:non-specific serine/threonine protein kinase/serine/threonine-protein kinase
MGTVFLAERIDHEFERQVAVKFLRQGFFSPSARQRFVQERQILARLQHPFIAQLLDGGTTGEGTPYLVMEYVEGVPITDYVAARDPSLAEKLDLFRRVCQAVSFAHQNLIVHRDLKPDNILITADGTPKLLDFGIAKLLSNTDIKATVTRQQALTPEYASPEQLVGSDITTTSDVYCLGIILYETLTGVHPFKHGNTTSEKIRQNITQSEPLRPSTAVGKNGRRGKTANPESANRSPKLLKGDLDNIVLKALRREPERRYRSVEEFSRDVKFYLRGYPVTARPDTFFYRAKKFLARNRLASAAALIALVSLVGGLFIAAYQARLANIERERAERRFNDVRQLADSFMFEINDEIQRSPVRAREKLVERAVEYLDKLAQESSGNHSLESELATAYEKIGDIQSELFNPSLGKTSDALASHQKSLQIRERLFAAEPKNMTRGLDVVKSRLRIGDIYSMSGRVSEARETYLEVSRFCRELLAAEPGNAVVRRNLASAHARLGQAILRSGSLPEAQENYQKSLEIYQELAAQNSSDETLKRSIGIVFSYIGYVKMTMGKEAEAVRFYGDALAIEEQFTDENNLQARGSLGTAHLWFGIALSRTAEREKGLIHIRRALEIQKAIYEADKGNLGERNALGDCYNEFGVALLKNGQPDEAIKNLESAIENYEAIWKIDRQNLSVRRQVAYTQSYLADALAQKGDDARAAENYERALAAFVELTAADPNNTEWRHDFARCYLKTGELFLKKGEKSKALSDLRIAASMLGELSAASPENAVIRQNLETAKKHLQSAETR